MDILLADDHALVRDGLRPFLEELADGAHVLEAENFDRAQVAARGATDLKLIILDLAMPGMNGLAGVRLMMEARPDVPVVILSGTHDHGQILKAVNLGIAGFIPKSTGSAAMMQALGLILSGERYIPPQVLLDTGSSPMAGDGAALAEEMPLKLAETAALERLSRRERTVLELLVGGQTNKEIARSIDLQEATIKIHVKNIYRKLGVANRAQAVRMAIRPDLAGYAGSARLN